jgi:hypothetical protein
VNVVASVPSPAGDDDGLRLVVWDDTGAGRAPWQRWLTTSWRVGSSLYQRRRSARVDAAFGARSWTEALAWLIEVAPARKVAEVQFWGHGLFGRVFIGHEPLDEASLESNHAFSNDLQALRARLTNPDALFWLRTCSAFGGRRGQAFATALVDVLGCRAAGHTHTIGPLQSGLHTLQPGNLPAWSADEGIRDGDETQAALPSSWTAPHTITCLHGRIPAGW